MPRPRRDHAQRVVLYAPEGLIDAIDHAAKSLYQSRTRWVEDACRERLARDDLALSLRQIVAALAAMTPEQRTQLEQLGITIDTPPEVGAPGTQPDERG